MHKRQKRQPERLQEHPHTPRPRAAHTTAPSTDQPTAATAPGKVPVLAAFAGAPVGTEERANPVARKQTEEASRKSEAHDRQEADRRESEQRFRLLSALSPVGIFHTDAVGQVVYTNDRWQEMTGLTAEASLGGGWSQAIHPEDRASAMAAWETAARSGGEYAIDYRILTPQGKVRWASARAQALRAADGSILGHVGTIEDITSRKQAEEALRVSEERYRIINQSISDYAFSIHMKENNVGYLEWLTDSFTKLTGYAVQEMLGKPNPWNLYIHPDDQDRVARVIQRLRTGEPRLTYEFRMRSKTGALRWMRSYACAVYGENGEVVRIYGATQDITERRQAEEALKESEARYRTISQLIADYAYAVRITPDKRRILEWITAAFSRITGFTAHDLTTDEGLALLIHPEDMPYIQQRLDALFSGEASTGEYRIITKSGEVRWLQEYSSPEWDSAQSRVVRIIGAGRDITERKRLEALLQEQIIRPKDLGTNLRRFRQQLGMTQITFGQAFGGYSQRQITSYETGDIEIPMGLLLAIRDKGYPLEAVLGTGPTGTLDQVVGRLSHSWKTHETARRLVESILRLLDRESATISTILQTLSVPPPEDDIRDYHTLREMLRRTGIELPVAPSQGKTT